MAGPLVGVTVVEIAGIGPGPFAGMLLADMGARVIRIDRKPSEGGSGMEALMRNDSIVDRGRESIAVDMKSPRGISLVLEMVAKADVLIEGFRPGVMEKLGLGPDVCLTRNAKLVYARMTGWGQTGPLAQVAGHDLNYIALSGALHAMGPADRPPAPPLNLVGDYGGGGMLLALGVVSALFEAQRSGKGQVVDAAMTDGSALLMSAQYGMMKKGFWRDTRESNFLDGAAHFYGVYACADSGYVSIGAIEPQFYRKLLEICEINDPHFTAQWEHGEWPALKAKLAELIRTRTRDAWCALLEGTDACFAPVLSMQEAPLHAHNQARGTFVTLEGVAIPAPAPRFGRTPSQLPQPAPLAGQNTLTLLGELGYGAQEVDVMVSSGIVFDHTAPSGD